MTGGPARRAGAGLAALAAVAGMGLVLLAGCGAPPPPATPEPVYLLGQPYSLGGVWSYPREDFGLVETGLGTVIAEAAAGRRTANGEVYDPAALTAAHRTLQLPAILRVTNLENGRILLLRANDRGPADPGRVLAVSRRAAELLGMSPGRPAQLRVAVEGEPSRALAVGLPRAPGEAPALAVATAATVAVQREDLAPPPGAQQAAVRREGRAPAAAASPARETGAELPPLRLPETLLSGPAMPGRLVVQLGSFTGADGARRQAARIPGARAEAVGSGRRAEWRVRLGPFPDVAAADRALEQVLRSGVSEARILVD
ncbi:SPOR domain-containing protein [Roseomonas sp. OT10]|uniref:septal ring lytic transglycosylase RlpA family protein n=1 Tax=Roseomonas cutis TaxID=2897332 RepID=UPI001E2A4715|nr:RlpA-like double-psi beta-barrel domain-containing protein [Roseomonas sp. OT10]UFN50696.1 SPOR domain-containing protein [Roseomonas sp. OT10]